MASPKPIVKIKRGNTPPTTQLAAGELGVNLATNRLYIGIASPGSAVAIGAEVDTAITLGGTNTSDNKIATEKAAKEYITSKLVAGTQAPKDTLFATISANTPAANASPVPQNINLSSAVIEQSANMNLLRDDPNFGSLTTGFFQTTKTEMILNVTYSLQISAVDVDSNAIELEGTNIGFWRLAGLRVIDTNATANVTYYGMQVVLPVIGTSPISLPTLISGNACVRLPKYVSGGTQWELQLVYQIRSNDGLLDIGTGGPNNFVNDPEIGAAKGIRIQIVKISESAT
jgi:hypothetical protein